MPSIYQWSEVEILLFCLAFIRITALITSFPIFGVQTIPNSTKVLLALVIGIVLFPSVKIHQPHFTKEFIGTGFGTGFLWLAFREALVGLIIGTVARLYFMSINIAGQIMSTSLGLSTAQIFNPMMGSQSNAIEQFQFTLAMMLFLSFNGHHFLLIAMNESFKIIPMSFDMIKWEGVKSAAIMGSEILSLGLRLCVPIVVALFLSQVSMGVIGRVVPQINVLVTSLHLTIVIGLFVIFMTLPFFLEGVHEVQNEMGMTLFKIMKEL